jgi:hypothetical protein
VGSSAGSESPSVDSEPWSGNFEAEIMNAKSDFVRTVLSDHVVTDAEYQEARAGFVGCLHDLGVDFIDSPTADGLGDISYAEVAGRDDTGIRNCEDLWFSPIQSMYLAIRENPNQVDWLDAMAACFVSKGLVAEGFTGADLKPLMDVISYTPTSDPVPGAHPTLPGGVLVDGEETADCFVHPFQAVGGFYAEEDE